jgi:hypothetical protein
LTRRGSCRRLVLKPVESQLQGLVRNAGHQADGHTRRFEFRHPQERLTQELEEEVVERQATAADMRVAPTRRLSELADERRKLLRAYYANAPARAAQGRAGPDLFPRGLREGRACDHRGRPRQVAGDARGRHSARRKLPCRLPQGPPQGARSLQPSRAGGRLHQGPQVQRPEFTEVFEALFSRPNSNRRAMVGLSGCYSNRVGEFQGLVVDLQCEAERTVQLDDLVRAEYSDR